jgi:hypothetical protein
MCIACELGYWTMIDVLEAERNASKGKAARADNASEFVCEAPVEQPKRRPRSRAAKSTRDERAP